jgi:hypothetical protein
MITGDGMARRYGKTEQGGHDPESEPGILPAAGQSPDDGGV